MLKTLGSAQHFGVGSWESESFGRFVLTGADPQENTAFELRLWKRIPKLSDGTEITGVEFE